MILSPYGVKTWAPLLLVSAAAAIACWFVFWPLSIVFGVAFLLVANFFRDPDRRTDAGEGAVISPADGKVVEIAAVEEPEHVSGPALKIAVFMNVFNVHVNRAPCEGRVEWLRHVPGRFLNAIRSNAGLENERTLIALRDRRGRPVLVRLIAGLIARRIVCAVRKGDVLARGRRLGMIKFGSRVEVFLPKADNFVVRVRLGDAVSAGRTVLGEWQ